METYGARCVASPSEETTSGRAILAKRPDHPGSLGIAIRGGGNRCATRRHQIRSGLVLSHVLLHQTVIGQEALAQLEMADDYPDVIIGCAGGGSNFAGIAFPFIGAQPRGGRQVRIIAVEPAACPTPTRGPYAYDFGDTAHLTHSPRCTPGFDLHPARLPRRRPITAWRRWSATSRSWA